MGQNAYTVGGYGIDVGETDVEILYNDRRVQLVHYGDMVLGEDTGIIICVPGTEIDAYIGEVVVVGEIPDQEKIDAMFSALREFGFSDLSYKLPKFLVSSYYG